MREAAGNGAACVASQLLAFVRDPARWRPRFLHGKDPLPDGAIVLRFAQARFSPAMMRELPASARGELREAANAFIRQVCFREGATHYQVLCVPSDAQHHAIKESYHLMMALIHPDRRDAAVEPWPTDCAQRVNQAYAVLSDDALRQDYDARLKKLESGLAFAPQAPGRGGELRRKRGRTGRAGVWLAKALVAFTAVIATLLLLEVWLADPSDEYSMLQGAFSVRHGRDVPASADRPRFIGTDARTSSQRRAQADTDAPRPEGFTLFGPLWRAFAGSGAETPAAAPNAQVSPVEAPRPVPSAPQAAAQAPGDSPVMTKDATPAQASAPPPAPASGVSAQDIEVLVARLIGYYEAGDTDKLMSLLDLGNAGFWQTAKTRQTYFDFFRATRQRRLRVNNLAWRTAAQSAQAKGEATVFAEYFDEPGTLERRVDVEMDIAMRDGMPKITRLSLFPDAR